MATIELNWQAFANPDVSGWAHLCICTERQINEAVLSHPFIPGPSTEDITARFIRAQSCQDWFGNYPYWEAAFQFPYYPGFNRRIFFNECMQDLSWMPAHHYLTIITNANLLLQHEYPGYFAGFLQSIGDTATFWNQPHENHANYGTPFSSNAVSFHVLFQCEASEEADTLERYTAAGIQFADITR